MGTRLIQAIYESVETASLEAIVCHTLNDALSEKAIEYNFHYQCMHVCTLKNKQW